MIVSGTTTLLPNRRWSQSQTRKQIIDCKTAGGPVVINLPTIEDLIEINAQGVVFTINDLSNNASANNITINASGEDEIDESTTTQLVISKDGASVVLAVGTNGQWIGLESSAVATSGTIKETITLIDEDLLSWTSASPIELKPTLPINQAYNLEKMVMKLNYGTSAYAIPIGTTAITLQLNGSGAIYASITPDILTNRDDAICIVYPQSSRVTNVSGVDTTIIPLGLPGNSISLGWATTGVTVSGGDGSLVVDLYYTIETF